MVEKHPKNYCMIKNSLVEALSKIRLSGYETSILFAIIRKTYGFMLGDGERKTSDWISLSQLNNMTGIAESHISRTLKILVDRKIITKRGKNIGINKDTYLWENLPKGVNTHNKAELTKRGVELTKRGNENLPKGGGTKETITKETITKENYGKPVFEKGNGMESIKGIINKFQTPAKSGASGISTQWQEKAFRYAKGLNLTLTGSSKGRWLKMFKQASEGRKTANLDEAYTFLFDYPKQITNEQKMLFFFKIYENGKSWMNKFEGR
jgi:phage replication O-like protein O